MNIFAPIINPIAKWINGGSSGRDVWIRRGLVISLMIALLIAPFWVVPNSILAADPNGADTVEADPNAPVNMAWTLIAGFLVWFMQLGFAFLGAGLIRSKNKCKLLTKSSWILYLIPGFWAFGFAFMFGGSNLFSGLEEGNSIIGYSGFFLTAQL
jgi:Amt family ammonium transporter